MDYVQGDGRSWLRSMAKLGEVAGYELGWAGGGGWVWAGDLKV